MSLFDKFNGKKKRVDLDKLSRLTIDTDKWDREDYQRLLEDLPEFNAERDRICDRVQTGNGLWSDVFHELMKPAPKLLEDEEIRPSYLLNRVVMEEMQGLSQCAELRQLGTVGDDVASAMGTMSLRSKAEEIFDRKKTQEAAEQAEQLEAQLEAQEQLEQAERSAEEMFQDLQNQVDQASDQADPDTLTPEQQAAIEQLMDQCDQAGQAAKDAKDAAAAGAAQGQALSKALEKNINGLRPGIANSLREGLKDAIDEATDLQSFYKTWGMEPGELQKLPTAQRMALAQRLMKGNERFRRIAELVGPMKRIAFSEQTRKVKNAVGEIYDVTRGADLPMVLPEEFASLADPDSETMFLLRLLNGELMQYKTRGEEKIGKGAIIVCEDGSGSMKGEREMWAKAVCICLMHVAHEQHRAFRVIHFGSRNQMWEMSFEKDADWELERILEVVEKFWNGGTDFETPLNRSLKLLDEEFVATGAVKADIVFLTDGACGVTDEFEARFQAEKERLGFVLWGINVATYRKSEPLWTLADGRVCQVHDLVGGDDIRDVFGGVGHAA